MLKLKKDFNPKDDCLGVETHISQILNNNNVDYYGNKIVKVTCDKCGKNHFPDEDTFIVVYGNITVGFNGGIIGNHFHKDGTLARVSVYCKDRRCCDFIENLFLYKDDEVENQNENLYD